MYKPSLVGKDSSLFACEQGYKKVRAEKGTAIKVKKGDIVEKPVTNVTMVKNVSGTPQAFLQNTQWPDLLIRLALLAAVVSRAS